MSATYVPTAYYHETTVLPSPSDWATAASVNEQALKYLTDNSKYFKTELGKFWDGINISVPSGNVVASNEVRAGGIIFSNTGFSTFGNANIFGSLVVGETASVTGNATIGGGLTLSGTGLFNSNIVVAGVAGVGSLQSLGNVFVGGTIDGPGGVTTIEEDLFIRGQIIGNAQFDGNIELAGEINSFGGDTVPLNANVEVTGWLDVTEPSRVPGTPTTIVFPSGSPSQSIPFANYNFIVVTYAGQDSELFFDTDIPVRIGDWVTVRNLSSLSSSSITVFAPGANPGGGSVLHIYESVTYVYFGDAGYLPVEHVVHPT